MFLICHYYFILLTLSILHHNQIKFNSKFNYFEFPC
nr:MAG TPA: hypothetical protein [Caudoviricetes sp.]